MASHISENLPRRLHDLHLKVLELYKPGAKGSASSISPHTTVGSRNISYNNSRQGYCSTPCQLRLQRYFHAPSTDTPSSITQPPPVNFSFRLAHYRVFAQVCLVEKCSFAKVGTPSHCFEGCCSEEWKAEIGKVLCEMCPHESYELSWSTWTNFSRMTSAIDTDISTLEAVVGATVDCLGASTVLTKEELKDYVAGWVEVAKKTVQKGGIGSTYSLYVEANTYRNTLEDGCRRLEQPFGLCHVIMDPFVAKPNRHVVEVEGQSREAGVSEVLLELKKQSLFWDKLQGVVEGKCKVSDSTSSSAIQLGEDPAMGFLEQFRLFRSLKGLRAVVVEDFWPNLCILFENTEECESSLLAWLRECSWQVRRVVPRRGVDEDSGKWVFGKRLFDEYLTAVFVEDIARHRSIVLSGKRFSGKSWLAGQLEEKLGIQEYTLAETIKRNYCKLAKISLSAMLQDRELKESHRDRLVAYSESEISKDKLVWNWSLWRRVQAEDTLVFVVSDLRREHELDFFRRMTDCIHVRVTCSEDLRKERGWIPSEIDKSDSETGLDAATFDYEFQSDASTKDHTLLQKLLNHISQLDGCKSTRADSPRKLPVKTRTPVSSLAA